MKIEKDIITGAIIFHGTIEEVDLIRLDLDKFDRLLLDECSASSQAADWLLCLEMLFRRSKEQAVRSRLIVPVGISGGMDEGDI